MLMLLFPVVLLLWYCCLFPSGTAAIITAIILFPEDFEELRRCIAAVAHPHKSNTNARLLAPARTCTHSPLGLSTALRGHILLRRSPAPLAAFFRASLN